MRLNKNQEWEKDFRIETFKELKIAGIELTQKNIPLIIKGMAYENRSKKYPDKCLCYKDNSPCHPEIKDLNCFICPCPEYMSELPEGGCRINSKKGKMITGNNFPKGKIWDCSDCTPYHSPEVVEKYLRKNMSRLQKMFKEFDEQNLI